MYKFMRKLTALGLSAALCLLGTGAALAQTQTDAASKEETVYVLTDAEGGVQRIIVSDWLRNPQGVETIEDQSDATEIENVKGDETHQESDGAMLWNAQGEDIYYRGESDKALPLEVRVSYELDGEAISGAEIGGKSGRVRIRFDYESKYCETVEICGTEETIYLPFVTLTALVLDGEHFQNVEVTNGRIINDGDRSIIVGLGLIGLGEHMTVENDEIELPNYLEICADATEFELDATVTLATNEPLSMIDSEKMDIADLTASMTALTDAMGALIDGSSALYDGLSTLSEQTEKLTDGVEQLAEGASALTEGAESLNGGAAQLQTGAASLANGLQTLCASSADLNGGAATVFGSLLTSATSQVQAAGVSIPELTIENYAEVLDGVSVALESAGAAEGAQTIAALKASLDSYNAFYLGLSNYTAGVDSAAAGAVSLSEGASTLAEGAATLATGVNGLDEGVQTLRQSMSALQSGVTQLCDGALELSEGLARLNEEGVQKLSDAVQGDLETAVERLRAGVELSKAYRNYAGISDEMNGQVKFIYRTEEICAESSVQ